MSPEKKRKGLGGMTPEKKRLLKQLIMQKAAEDMKKKQEAEAREKQKFVEGRVPKLELEGKDADALQKLVTELVGTYTNIENEKYDWELKIRKQDFEINELTIKVNDIKGKFVKPPLTKVNKADSKLAKFQKDKGKEKLSFREELKSTGKSKYALEEKEETKHEFSQDLLKKKEEAPKEAPKEEGGEEAPAAEEAEEEEEAEDEEEDEEEEEEE